MLERIEKQMAKVAGILGKKVGMTQLFDSKGDVRPATVLQAGPCVVTQHKSQTKDGYDSAQIGLVEFVKESRLTQPMRGHLAKNNVPPVKFIREVPIEADVMAESKPATACWLKCLSLKDSWTSSASARAKVFRA